MTPEGGAWPRRLHLALGVVALLSVFAVLPAVNGEWIFDDGQLIAWNPSVHQLSAATLRDLLTQSMWHVDGSAAQQQGHLTYYRPLLMLTYALDWHWSGGQPFAFHVTNIALHALTILLAGRALYRWTGSSSGALLGAACFGLHPAKAESVAWISGRPDLLATLGMLLALEGLANRRRAIGVLLFALGAFVGFASKETTLLLPVLMAIELGTAGAFVGFASFWRKSWPVLAASLCSLFYVAARQLWLPRRVDLPPGFDITAHVAFVLETLGRGAMYLLAPFDLSMTGPFLTEQHGAVTPNAPYAWSGAVVILVLALAAPWSWRRRRRVFWALAAFVSSLVPVSNLIWIGGLSLTSPRFFYLPSLLLAWLAIELGRGRFQALTPRFVLLVGSGSALTLALLLALQSSVYASALAFWTNELRSRPDVPANIEYFVDRDWQAGDHERSLARSFCEYRMAVDHFSARGRGARTITRALQHWASVIPDADRPRLSAIADFLAAARSDSASNSSSDSDSDHATAKLPLELSVEIPATSSVRQALRQFSAPSLTLEAELRVRLEDPARALHLIRQARANCPACLNLLDRQARVAYRAFDPDFAEQLGWNDASKRPRLAALRSLNAAIANASGAERTQLEIQRSADVGLPAQALRLLENAPDPQPQLNQFRLHLATLAGDAPAAARAARDLGMPPPELTPPLSQERVKGYIAQFKDGCAFADEVAQ